MIPVKSVILLLSSFISFHLKGQDSQFESVIEKHLKSFPQNCEIAIGIIADGSEIKLGYKKVNSELERINNSTKLFEIGSATKVFTAALLAKEIQQGTISLDDPIAKHLDFEIKKDSFQNEPIRIKHLATHTSGLKRGPFMSYTKYSNYLKDFELDYLPGKDWSYNNLAIALLGHIIIQKNGSSWQELLSQNILTPLQMIHTYATSDEAPEQNRMQCFKKNGKIRNCQFEVQKPFIWPSGAIVSNTEDMLKWLRANINDEALGPGLAFIQLAHNSLGDSIKTGFNDESTQGLVWWHLQNSENERILCHGGTTPDHTIFIAFDKANKKAVVVYANISWPLLQNKDGSLRTNNLGLDLLKMEVP